MPRKPTKYIVKLTEEQRSELLSLVNKGEHNARIIKRANILLLSDQGKTAPEIAENLSVSEQTVYNIRKRFTNGELDSALYEKPRPGARPKFQPQQEAYLIALACSEPPDGRERWTIRMLTNKVVELGILDEVGRETVRRTLKKTSLSRGRRSNGASPE
jgi:transposase